MPLRAARLQVTGLALRHVEFHAPEGDADVFESAQLWGAAGLGQRQADDASTPWAPTAAAWIDGVEESDAFKHAFGAMTAVGFRFYFSDY
jgi:hypothetical protein